VQHDIEQAESERVLGQSIRPLMKTKIVKSVLADALANLFLRIESAQKEYKELDYNPLISELNELLRPVPAKIKSRSTRSKNLLASQKAAIEAASAPTPAAAV
jgi:hypothetical protein